MELDGIMAQFAGCMKTGATADGTAAFIREAITLYCRK